MAGYKIWKVLFYIFIVWRKSQKIFDAMDTKI